MSKSTIICLYLWMFVAGYWFGERSMMKKAADDMASYQIKLNNCIEKRIK